MERNKKQYSYDGPVLEFDRLLTEHWKATTFASSPSKAKSNLAFRFKKETNRMAASKITLPGPIKEIS